MRIAELPLAALLARIEAAEKALEELREPYSDPEEGATWVCCGNDAHVNWLSGVRKPHAPSCPLLAYDALAQSQEARP